MGILDGKVAIVTGAGHGIGRGEALELAAQGATVVVNDVGGSVHGGGTDKAPAEEVAEIIRKNGGQASANYSDVADWEGAKALVQQAVDDFGHLDILVNNAGIVRDAMLFSMKEEDFDSVVRVHLKGTFATTHHASVYWREASKAGNQPRAAIVNTVSSAGLQGNVGQANYGAAKAGIAALTVISSLELSRQLRRGQDGHRRLFPDHRHGGRAQQCALQRRRPRRDDPDHRHPDEGRHHHRARVRGGGRVQPHGPP